MGRWRQDTRKGVGVVRLAHLPVLATFLNEVIVALTGDVRKAVHCGLLTGMV